MNVDYNGLLDAMITALNDHTWPGTPGTPVVLKGPRRATIATGPIAIVSLGAQGDETGIMPGTYGENQKVMMVTVGVPWLDTDQNEADRCSMMSETEKVIMANRQLDGLINFVIKGPKPLLFTLLAGQQSYRGAEYTLTGLDYRH